MPLETNFHELPKVVVAAGVEFTLKLRFSKAVKLLELQHSAAVELVRVTCADKVFEADAYKSEVVPGSVEVVAVLKNKTDKEAFVRAGWYVESQAESKVAPPAPPSPPALVAPETPTHYVPQVNPNDPHAPPPPGASKSFQMGDQQITLTTPANGAAPNGHPPAPSTLAPGQAPGSVHSYMQGNQQIRVSAPAAQPQTAHSEVIAAVVAPRVRPGPETVTVGMDEVAILMKRSEAENMLKILNGAIMHPAFCTPIIGAVQRALGA